MQIIMLDPAPQTEEERRLFTPARAEQGFVNQAHLDAFYAHFDHSQAECAGCTPSVAYVDDSLQGTIRECPVALELFRASFVENFR